MAKHKRLKPIREYLFDKGEMIEQMFSSIPIVEVRNMVPMKLQGMPLHELKAECLVELLEMSDREIMNILEGKKSREEPSSSESDGGGVVVISDDEKRVKKERKSNWRPTLRKEESEGSSTERSSSNKKKKNKRKSKEKDDTKGRKKIKMESRKPTPSHSKDVPMKKEVSVKKIVAKVPERPKPPVGEVVVLDDISSEEDVSEVAIQEDVAKEGGKKTGEKSLLDLLELEMRARAIRSLLKKEEETQAQKILSEYQDEPDDLIPVEVAPPQVDLLSDSDEESNLVMKQELSVQQSAIKCLELEVEGDTLLSKDGGLDSLLGIEKDETSDVVEMIEVDELSIDSAQVNSPRQSSPAITALKQSDTSKSIEFVEETKSLGLKDAIMHREIIVKIEEDIDEPNQHRKTEFLTVNSTLDSAQHSSKIQKKSANLKKSSAISNTVEIQTQQLVTSQAEIVKLKDLSHKKPLLSGEETSYSVMPNSKSSAQQADDERNNSVSVKKEPETPGYDNVFAAGKVEGKENVENVTSKTLTNVELKMSPSTTEGVDNTKEATVNAQKVCNMKSGGASVISDPAVSSVESNKPQSISAGFDSNFDEEVLDYDYDLPLMNSLRQPCVRSSPSDVGNLVLADEKMSRLVDVSSSKMPIPFELEAVTLSDDDEPDSIQPAEVKVLNQDKCDSTLDSSKERRLSEQGTSKSVCNSTQGINFLVRDALGSPELSQKTTVESQERAKIVESLDLVQGERCRVDGTINAIESASQESENLAETSIFDGRSSKITTPKVNKEVLDLENYQDSNSVQSTELMISDKVKNYCTSLGAKDKQIPPECFSEGITNESQKHGHFLVIDSLDSQEATTPGSTLDSPDSTKDPISSQMDGKAVIYSDLDCQEASKSPGSQLRETNTGGQNLVDKKASEMARSHSSASLLIKDAGKEEERSKLGEKNHDPVDEVASTQCNIIEEQHFLVDAALDSPNAERSKTKTLDQEPSELYLNVDSDVLRKRDSPLSSQNQKPGIKNLGIERDCGVYVTTEIFASNRDGHFSDDKAVESLKSGTSVTNQECLDYEVRNKESILGGADFISTVTRMQKNIPKGKIDSSIALSSLCVASIHLKGQGKDTRPFENETTAFVGCNSIEIQKSVRLTNGQAVSQTNSLNNASHESLTMDCILVSSEGEDELNGVSGKNLVESIACSSKTIPACDDPSYQCASQRHPIRGSLLSVSTSSCDVLISSDDHSSHGIPCLKKILSNEGDPCRKFPSSRAIESTCEPSQPSLTVVERRGCGGPEPDEPPPGKINQENQTFPGIEHHESPCVSPAPSSIMKTSRFPIVVQDVQAEKGNSKLIEKDYEVEQITIENKNFVGTQCNQEHSCVSFVTVSTINSSLPKPSQCSLQTVEEVPGASKDFLETTSCLPSVKQSGYGNYDSEVIEIFDEDSTGSISSKDNDFIIHKAKCSDDLALLLADSCPAPDPNLKDETSSLGSTQPFSSASKSLVVLEMGNCNPEVDVMNEAEENQSCNEPNHSKKNPSPLETYFPSSALCYTSMTFCSEPSQPTNQLPLLGLHANRSGTVNDNSEIIEIDDDDSANIYSEKKPITLEAKSGVDSTPQQGDSGPTSDSSLVLIKQRNCNSDVEKQTCDGHDYWEETASPHMTTFSSPAPPTNPSNLEPTQSLVGLGEGIQTNLSETMKNNSEVIEIDDETSAHPGSSRGREPITHQDLEDSALQKGDSCPTSDTTSITKTSILEQTKPFSACLDQLEEGNSNSGFAVTREESSDVYKNEEKRTCDEPKSSSLEPTSCPLVLGLKTYQSVPGSDKSELIEIDDEDSAGSCGEEESPTLKATFKDNNTTSKTKTTTLKQRQPSFPVPKNLDLLEKGNSNSEVDYSKRLVSSDVSKDERNRNSDGPDHLVETQSPQNTHSSIVSSSAVTAGNNNPEVIEIDDEDLTGICNKETSNMTKYSEETSPHQGNSSPTPTPSSVTGELCIETGDNKIVNGTNHCEIIEIDDEDSEYSSSGEDGDSETSSEESQQSYDTVHSISDDDVPNGSQLQVDDLGFSDKMETESGCITGDAELSLIQSKLLSLGEGLPNTGTSTELEEVAKSYIIDISDSASEDPHAELIGHQESESVLGNNDNQNNAECQSALVQKVDTNLSDDACSNLISEPDTVSGNHFIHSLQTSNNLHCSREDEHREINSQDRLRREQAPPEKELEEGEIEGSDGVPETIEDYGTRKARNRPHKKRLLNITTDSDFSDESIRRIRIKSKLKLRKRRKKIISDLHKIETAKKTKDISKDQENVSQKDRPIEAISGIPTMTINLSKQTTVDTCDTVVIEDDEEEIVEAITKQMPPEILELDDSDEAKTNWTARWLESSHVKKVVTTSKILTNARKKMKMKLKMKEVPEIEAAPLLAVAPELIGSVEEYHRLVKEGVITSSSKDTSSEKKGAAEKSEAMPISEADVECGNKEQIDKANSPNENEMTSDLCFQVELLGEKLDSFEKKTGGKRIVKSDTIVPPSNASIRAPDKESPLAQPLHDENSSIVAGKLDADLIDETVIPKVEGEKMSEVPESNQQPLTSETGTVGNVSDSVNLDPISSSIKSFYEMMNPNQVVGFDLYSKSLSEIPIPPVVSNNYVEESNTTVPNHPIELPLKGTFPSGNADSNTVGDTNRSGPSNNLTSDMIEVNSTLTVDTKNLTAAKPIHLSPGNELEEGEIAESDNEIIATVKTPNNVWVVNRSPQVQSTLTIPSSANVRDNRFDNRISTKLNESSFSAAYTSNSINPFVSTVNLSNQYTPTSGKYVGSLPNPSTNQVVGQSIGIVHCNNIAGSSSLVHPARVVTSTSRSTLSSVVPPSYPVPSSSYNVPGGQATHSIINSTLPNVALSGDAPVVVPINPIQAATAEINSRYPYGDPTGSSTHPQMSVNVNSTLQMYDPYYSWVYRQGLSGSLNSSYGYGIPEQSQDASTIYKQWGEYYKKLMEACQDSAARAGVSTMFEPPKMIESKSYSWVFEHPNQALNEPPTVADTPETSTTAPKEVVSVPSQAPSGEWNYRYGLKGLLNEHFVTPGITPPSTASSSTPQGDIRGRKRAGRGRRKRKKKI